MMFHDVDFCVIAVERGLVIEAEVPNPAVSKELMKEIMKWRQEGCTMDDVIGRLRKRTVPSGYSYHTWHKGSDKQHKFFPDLTETVLGMSETVCDMARSILAQLEFVFQIKQWESKGVPFSCHLYVPERHPITGCIFCEREDEGHVFKVRKKN